LDDAERVLQSEEQPLPQLYLALVELGRGKAGQATAAVQRAVGADRSRWPWEDQQEFELLRHEVENRLTPPRMDKLP
jgi:hypothetical protein